MPLYSGEQDSIDLGVTEEVFVTIPRDAADNLEATVDVGDLIQAPVEAGQVMGQVNVVLEDEVIYQGDVIALQSVAPGGIVKRVVDWASLMIRNMFSD